MKLPRYLCTKVDYPNIHKDYDGCPMPEVLGHCSITATESDCPGAIEAILVDKTTHKYLAARGSLKAVNEVYGNGKLINAAGYAISYADGGKTYITFTTSKAAKKITFNADGYMYANWNSANGYVENPAYVILFFLGFFREVAQEDLDIQSFVDMAAYFTAQGWHEAGKLILQEQFESVSILEELLNSFGLNYWKANDGRMKIGRRDASDFLSAPLIFAQLDILEEPKKPTNFEDAINYLNYSLDFFPTSNTYKASGLIENLDSQELLEKKEENFSMPWTTDENMAFAVAQERLCRRAYGRPMLNIKPPFFWIDTLDIFSNVAFQDLFGINVTGGGEAVGYYCVAEIGPDFENYGVNLALESLDWLIGIYDEENQLVYDESGALVYPE